MNAAADPVCSVCHRLHTCWGSQTCSLARALLVPPPPETDIERFDCHCPECGAVWRFHRETEDFSSSEHLRLLSWREVLRMQAPEAQAALCAALPAQRARWNRQIEATTAPDWTVREAARNLAELACTAPDWHPLAALLGHPRAGVATAAVRALYATDTFETVPDDLVAALAQSIGDGAQRLAATLRWRREGVPTLLAGEHAPDSPWLARLAQEGWSGLRDDQSASLVALLRPGVPSALRDAALAAVRRESDAPETLTADALWDLLAEPTLDLAVVQAVLPVLTRRHGPVAGHRLLRLLHWLPLADTQKPALDLLSTQFRCSTDPGVVASALVDTLPGPHGPLAARVLGSWLALSTSHPAPDLLRRLLDLRLAGCEAAQPPLLAAAVQGGFAAQAAHLRGLLAGSAAGSPLRHDLAALLVHATAGPPAHLEEWLSDPDPIVVKAAVFEGRWYPAAPYLERLADWARAGQYGAAHWLAAWGMRTPDNARAVLQRLPQPPVTWLQQRWQELERRAR